MLCYVVFYTFLLGLHKKKKKKMNKNFSTKISEFLSDLIHDVTSYLRYEWYKKHVWCGIF